MKFSEAIKALEEGQKIRCVEWGKKDFWHKDILNTSSSQNVWSDAAYRLLLCMLSNWEIYQEREKTYTFMEVVSELKEGKRFRRKNWINPQFFLVKEADGYVFCFSGRTWLQLQDFEATDWIEVT